VLCCQLKRIKSVIRQGSRHESKQNTFSTCDHLSSAGNFSPISVPFHSHFSPISVPFQSHFGHISALIFKHLGVMASIRTPCYASASWCGLISFSLFPRYRAHSIELYTNGPVTVGTVNPNPNRTVTPTVTTTPTVNGRRTQLTHSRCFSLAFAMVGSQHSTAFPFSISTTHRDGCWVLHPAWLSVVRAGAATG